MSEDLYRERLQIVEEALSDGFQLRDLAVVLREGIELADQFLEMSGSGKRELAVSFCREIVKRTDGPGPDVILDPILEAILPPLIDLIIEATRGKLFVSVPQSEEEEA